MLRTYILPVCSLIIDNAETIILHFVGIVKLTFINFVKL